MALYLQFSIGWALFLEFRGADVENCTEESIRPRSNAIDRLIIVTIVSSNKAITVFVFELIVHVFFCLFHSDVHEAIQTRQYT